MNESLTAGRHATTAVRASFFIGGFGTATWAPLVPFLRDRLAIGDDTLGMLLLLIGCGSLLTMPLSGNLTARFGCRRVITAISVIFALLLLALSQVSSLPLTIICMLLFGMSMGCIDVAINIAAILVESSSGKRLMSSIHACWSLGGFFGAGLYGLWVGFMGWTPFISTVISSIIILGIITLFSTHIPTYGGKSTGKLITLPRGVVIFVGIIALGFFLVEGAIMDWSGVYLVTVRNMDIASAGMGFTVFSAAMLTMRFLGDITIVKLGQRTVVLGGSSIALAGMLLVIFAANAELLYLGFFCIGIGCANMVPVFFSMLGRQNDMPVASAMAAVSSMGYTGVLLGPALIGFIAHATNLEWAFGLLAGIILVESIIGYNISRRIA